MRRVTCAFALVFAAIALAGCPKNNQDFQAAQKAEAVNDYDTALVHYDNALRAQPSNAEYKLHALQMRMEDAQYHVDQGQKALNAGNLQLALSEFQRAQNVDPSNDAADEGLKKTMDMIAAKNAPPTAAAHTESDEDAGLLQAPPDLKPLSRTPININATEDSRMIYETIGKLAGLAVEFDPSLTSRRISVDLTGVTLEQALDAVSAETGDFWKPLTSTVIFVAPDNPQKRRDLEDEEVKTFYLANTETPQDLTEIVTGLRQLLDLRRVQPVNAENAIIIRDTPDKIALAEKIINDADKAKPEVLIHVQVLTANLDRLRDLGILPGQSASLTFNPTCAVQPTSSGCSTTTTSSTTSTTTTTPGIALNELKHLSTADYDLTLPGATANAVLTDSQTRIIQDPEVRISDGEKATLMVGEKVPIATGSFQAGVGVSTTSVSPLVNTQFQYQDVGVKVTVTPRVHPDGSVSLKQTIEVTAVASEESIGGITEPVISSDSIDHDVRLKDGEVSVLGGLISRTEIKNLNGIPGAAQLPLLKYLFSDNSNEVQTNEVLIVITPHVIRFPSIDAANLASIASGTDTNARVYRANEDPIATPAATTASTAPPAAVAPPTAAQQQPQPSAANAPQAQAAVSSAAQIPSVQSGTAAAQLHFGPSSTNLKVGDTSIIALSVSGVNDLYSIPLMIHYNPAVIDVQEVRDGGFLSGGNQQIAIVQQIDKQTGQVIVSATRQPNTPGVSGTGTLIGLVIKAIGPGTSPLQVLEVNARDSQRRPIPMVSGEATVQVQ